MSRRGTLTVSRRTAAGSSHRIRGLVVVLVALVLMVPAVAATGDDGGGGGSGGGGGGGGGGSPGGESYADLVVALRDVDGLPVLAEYEVVDEETGDLVTERCVQPISATEIPEVDPVVNAVDGRTVWPVPLMGETLGATTAAAPGEDDEDEVEACDPQPAYASYVVEVDLERLNMTRTTDARRDFKLAEVAGWLATATEISLDGGGRIMTDGEIHDAPPEYAAIFWSLLTTGTLPNLPTSPAEIGILDWLELSASAMGTTSGKEVPITIDGVVYYDRITGVVEDANADATDGWTLPYHESLPFASAGSTYVERIPDYGDVHYDRSVTFPGCATWLDVPTLSWRSGPVGELIGFAELPPVAHDGIVDNIAGYAQFADDARAVILYMHEHDVIPGFFIDPIGTDTCDEQAAALSRRPAVNWEDVPALLVRTESERVTATAYNPAVGDPIPHAALRLTLEAPSPFTSTTQATVSAVGGAGSVTFDLDDGDLVGRWSPTGGFPLAAGAQVPTTFDLVLAADAPLGEYRLTLELVDLDRGDLVVATDVTTTTVLTRGGTDDGPDDDGTGVLPDPGETRSTIERAGGTDRIETAILMSRLGFPTGATTAVLARADLYPDALAGVPLAGMLDAPVLLTPSTHLDDRVAAELDRLEATRIVLLGGTAALSDDVAGQLAAAGITDVERVGGTDRFDTAVKVAGQLPGDHAYVVEGADPDPQRGWPDALAVGPLAALHGRPILLVETDHVPDATAAALAGRAGATVVGGTVAVSQQVATQVEALVRNVTRIAGADRYETALRLAEHTLAEGADPSQVFVATGLTFPDALSSGAAAAARNGILLLVNGQSGGGPASEWLASHEGPMQVHVAGGPVAVRDEVMDGLGHAMGKHR